MRRRSLVVLLCALCAAPAFWIVPAIAAPQSDSPAVDAQKAPLTVDEVVSRMEQRNHEREQALRKFVGTRVYTLKYTGFFGTREAAMTVSLSYSAPSDKQFTIVSESGTKFIVDHVLKGLLQGEKEAALPENQQKTALTRNNYDFAIAGFDASQNPPQYILTVTPKHDYKFLYRGKIWVDGKDFAVTHIEAEPAKSPSFWVKKSDVNHRYEKVDQFWLPAENKTDSLVRLGGHAVLSIEYQSYKITDPATPAEADAHSASPASNKPSL